MARSCPPPTSYEKVVDPAIHRLHDQKVRLFDQNSQGRPEVVWDLKSVPSTALALLGTDTPKKIQLRKNFRNRWPVIEGYMARLCS